MRPYYTQESRLLKPSGKDTGATCVEMKPHISSSSQLGSQHSDGAVYGTNRTGAIGLNKAFSHHHSRWMFQMLCFTKQPTVLWAPYDWFWRLCPIHSYCFSKLTLYVWLWTLFRRLIAEAFTPIQSTTSLFSGPILYVAVMPPQIILESSAKHMTSKDKHWRKSSPNLQLLLKKGHIVFRIRGLDS